MQTYIGVKRVEAEPCEKDGKDGYRIIYPDGYESWSPKEVFESAYFPIEKANSLSPDDIDRFISISGYQNIDPKTTLVRARLLSGFLDYEASSCVDPANYDEAIGYEVGIGHIKDRLWKMLGFVLQWADHGLEKKIEH